MSTATEMAKPKFEKDTGFHKELKSRVKDYFEKTGLPERDVPSMYRKTATIMTWFVASYVGLMFFTSTWWGALLLSTSLALAMAGIGFSIMHDGNHGGYSDNKTINRVMGLGLDLLGGSSYIWRRKHNIAHHTYTNINVADDDIDVGLLGRMAPEQPLLGFHRAQQYYMWGLYSLLTIKWQVYDDFAILAKGKIGLNNVHMPKGRELVEFVGGKIVFFSWALVIPMFFHEWWLVLIFFMWTGMVLGFVLAIVFQLAHCVEAAAFPLHKEEGLHHEWAIHQIETTVDFAPNSKFLCWYLGGLNFQIEHHLFPKICHVHYPELHKIVEEISREYGVNHQTNPTFAGALASHFRWLRDMGKPGVITAESSSDFPEGGVATA